MDHLRRGNWKLVRDINRALVIDQLRKNGPISRTEIAKQTKLGLSTVTKIMDSLLKQNLVQEMGQGDSSGGRKPIVVDFNYNYGYCIGIRVVKQGFILSVTDLRPAVKSNIRLSFPDNAPVEDVVPVLIEGIGSLIEEENRSGAPCLGIGIGLSGLVNVETGELICSTLHGWNRINFRTLLEDRFDVPVFVDNDVNLYTLAEIMYGYGQLVRDFVVVAIGVGFGAGFALNGTLYRGAFGSAGEIGHTVLVPNGNLCHCGQKGCLETYVNDNYIIETARRQLMWMKESLLYDKRDGLKVTDVFDAARAGDRCAQQVLMNMGQNLGLGLLNLVNSLNPRAIILTGEHLPVAGCFLPVAQAILQESYLAKYEPAVELRISELGEDAWQIGAAAMVINELFQAPIYREKRKLALV